MTIPKMQAEDEPPMKRNAEVKIVDAAKQIKARNESIKVRRKMEAFIMALLKI